MDGQKKANAISLKVSPLTSVIDAAGGTLTIKLENNCKARICFKVKTTNIQDYKMSKIFGFVEPGKATDVLVTRTNGAAKKDRFVVEYCIAENDVKDPMQPFKKAGNTFQSTNIFCNAISNKSVIPSSAQPAIMRSLTSNMLTSSATKPESDRKSSASTDLYKSITYTPTVLPKE